MSEIAVVILNYNGCHYLKEFLPSVIAHSAEAEIIIADNASTDDSANWLKEHHQLIRVIQLDKNYGFCEGYNLAISQIDHTYTVLLNSDVEVSPNWLNPLCLKLKQNPDVAAVQPKILQQKQKAYFEYAGAAGGFIDSMGYPFCRGRLFDFTEQDQGQYQQEHKVFWTSGACMMIRTQLYKEMGGLDADFFAHMEEIDLCWKLHRAGYNLYCIPQSTVYHVGGGTLSKTNPLKTYLNFRNNYDLISRHLKASELSYKLPLRIIMDWSAAILFLVNGLPKHAWALFKAQLHFFAKFNLILKKRKKLNHKLSQPAIDTIYSGLVTFD
ncbi:MAG TPA: glycosyltransferase family 2 protein, partial [Cyclobacteriaceae bacterium]|nr:glycosyltransferase family 2 protein [Cyclobacteriaceae bacterium]